MKRLEWSVNYKLVLAMCMWLVARLCPTHCDPVDCNPPGSSVRGILQARILEQLAMPFSRGSSQPRDWTLVSHIAVIFFMVWDLRETLGTCSLPLTRIKSCAAAASDLQHLLKGVQGGEQKGDTLENLAGQVFRKILSGVDFMNPFLASPHI